MMDNYSLIAVMVCVLVRAFACLCSKNENDRYLKGFLKPNIKPNIKHNIVKTN